MIQISSASNEHYRRFIDLKTSRGIREHGEFILMGSNLVDEFLSKPSAWTIKSEIIKDGLQPLTQNTTVFSLSDTLFKEVDMIGTHSNLLVLEAPKLQKSDLAFDDVKGLELVCPLGDPSNLGAVIRSAVAFGASKIILTEEAAFPFHPKAVKASAGAVLNIPMIKTGRLVDVPPEKSYALDMNGTAIAEFKWPKNLRLIIGEEGPGLPSMKTQRLCIPISGVESLNATVAASIALFSYQTAQSRN